MHSQLLSCPTPPYCMLRSLSTATCATRTHCSTRAPFTFLRWVVSQPVSRVIVPSSLQTYDDVSSLGREDVLHCIAVYFGALNILYGLVGWKELVALQGCALQSFYGVVIQVLQASSHSMPEDAPTATLAACISIFRNALHSPHQDALWVSNKVVHG